MSLKAIFSCILISFLGILSFVFWQNWRGLELISQLNGTIIIAKGVQGHIQNADIGLLSFIINPKEEYQETFLQEITLAQNIAKRTLLDFDNEAQQERVQILRDNFPELLESFETYRVLIKAQAVNSQVHKKYEQEILELLTPASDQLFLDRDFEASSFIAQIQQSVLYAASTQHLETLESSLEKLQVIVKTYPKHNILYKPLITYVRNLQIYVERLFSIDVLRIQLQNIMAKILSDVEEINAFTLQKIENEQENIQWASVHTGGVVFAFSLIILVLLIRRSNEILQKIHTFSKKVALGDFTAKLELNPKTIEVGQISQWVNEAFTNVSNKIFWFESVLNSMRTAMVVVDEEFRFTFYNNVAAMRIGMPIEQGIEQSCKSICPDYMCNTARCPLVRMREINEKKGFFTKSLQIKFSHESKKYSISCVNLFSADQSHAGYILHLRDITKDEQMHQRALAASQAKSNFLSTMSHEIRTPINAILGFLQIFDRKNLSQKQLEQMDKIGVASSSLLAIVNDVLDFSKIEANALEIKHLPFCLSKTVDAVTSIMTFAASEKNLHLHVHVDPAIPKTLMGDAQKIEQVLMNLTNNAIKFTEKGSVHIDVALSSSILPTSSTQKQKVEVFFSVKDTGIGMSEETQERIFTPFTQADNFFTRRFSGTGIGLSISQNIVKLMHGTMTVESTLNQGSNFSFTIPFEVADASCITREQALGLPTENGCSTGSYAGKHVLVVEDNLINQEIAQALLESENLVVDLAENGQEAINILKEKTYDAIFMDMQMPVMNGIECTKRLRKQALDHKDSFNEEAAWLATVPIIAMTANALLEDKKRCLDAGMNAHIAKPIEMHVLQAELKKWLCA